MTALDIARVAVEQTDAVFPYDVVGHAAALGRAQVALAALLVAAEEQEARLDRIEERLSETIGMGG